MTGTKKKLNFGKNGIVPPLLEKKDPLSSSFKMLESSKGYKIGS